MKLCKSVFVSAFVAGLFFIEAELLLAYGAALIHECAHGIAAIFLGIKPKGIKVSLFGVNLSLPYVMNSKHKIFIWSAGPLASFGAGIYFYLLQRLFCFHASLYNFFVFANFAIGIFNLLPIFPLDGAVILRSVLTLYTGLISAAKKMRCAELFLSFLFFAACVALCIYKVLNFSMWAMALFLLLNKNKQKCYNITEKKMVLSGEIQSADKPKYIACHTGSELLCLAESISPDYTLVVAAFCDDKFVCDLNQNDIICGINKYGALCTIDKYIKGNLSLRLSDAN